ncbi:ER membrane protein complex subunit 4 [Lepeophtheirus salmonis]|uniref:ER membrane protein complex subunit 4 n=1 Tax=Lepeophtheirus salmonis TaxID=72036 RepID=UPI001AE477F5|nr:ER membrane protein complex subunit 4-like [Lepeophtheirus salmonis]
MSSSVAMTTQPSRHRSKWSLDFATKSKSSSSSSDSLPPGYSSSSTSLHAEAGRSTDPSLKTKRSWEIALGPIKNIPMNIFVMYMTGNTISIIPIMMTVMMAIKPIKTLFSVGATFKAFDSNHNTLGQKIVFIIGNLINVGLAMFKCHSMGILPTHASDWLAFADPIERMEWAYAPTFT